MREGLELTKKSWGLLRENRHLFRFPIVGAGVAILLTAALVLPGLYLIDDGQAVIGGLLAAIGLYGATFVSVYFAVGLAATADRIFRGEPATYADGMAVARANIAAIAGWAALSALVGVLVSSLQRLGGVGAAIAAAIVGTAWGLVSFMAVPVLAFENTGPVATLRRSASLFKDRWAGQVTGNIAIGGIVFLLGILPAIILIAVGGYLWADSGGDAGLAGGAVLVGVGAIVLVVALLIMQAMQSIFGVALYRYATTGTATATFSEAELQSAVRTK
ncbi:MAG: DUF6159 family protein [Chloroflexota bacterium]|nr:DUF6159 family protein [Chloroflexota bacterium]